MQTREQAARPRFTGRLWRDIKPNMNPNYLIKGVLPRDGLAVVWGAKKNGKSFWVFDLIMHVVTGRQYRSHKVRQGGVAYIALEGSSGFDNRVEAWRQRYCNDPDEELPLLLINERLNLVNDYRVLITAIRKQLPDVVLIVIDTLNRALAGDENNSLDMGKFIRAADALGTAFGCLVLLIHHCGIAGSRPRGHTSLAGADDASIAIERNKEKVIKATVEHAKDFEAGAVFASRLAPIEIGTDKDGDAVSSCVVVEVAAEDAEEAEDAEPADAGGRKVPKGAQGALDILRRLLASSIDSIAPKDSGLPDGTRVCREERWRTYFYEASSSRKQDTKKRAFNRAYNELIKAGIISEWEDGYVWLLPPLQTGQTGQTGQNGTNVPMSR
jgi:hypothetical protein